MSQLTINAFQQWCEKNNECFEFASTYGEPGYSDPEPGRCILFANWNNVPKKLADRLEREGYELEWCDEWAVHSDKAWRTSPDSHGWQASIVVTDDGEYLTTDDDAAEWIEYAKIEHASQPMRAVPRAISREAIEAEGWTFNEGRFENGWHPGQNDDPQKIATELLKRFDAVLFRVPSVGQFDKCFEVYTRNAE